MISFTDLNYMYIETNSDNMVVSVYKRNIPDDTETIYNRFQLDFYNPNLIGTYFLNDTFYEDKELTMLIEQPDSFVRIK